ncbi:phenylacetate--CoA ligase family protein [Fundidesulfovibrio putealis]|uniref:phenylacetate--CoA ligase family protein n=1 Tax=Fundidesulfovibrio putealis TaxID=270496 RepID=UPI000427E235|nr:AMP-binding protein [Fundidesulfovibrio putealis]
MTTERPYHDVETLPAAEREALLLSRVQELTAHAWANAPAFRVRMEQAGLSPADITGMDAFARIPVLRKKDLMAAQAQGVRLGGLLGVDFGRLRHVYQSPGPIYDPESREPDSWGWTEAFHAAGFRPGGLVQNTFSYHLTPAGMMFEEPLHELGCAVIPAGPGNTPVQIELLSRLPVTGFVGMTSYLRAIGEKALEMGLDPKRDFQLQVGFVAAERLSESLRSEVEAMFGMVIRQGYGTADVGAIAYECRELGGMHATSRGIVEICDPQSGLPVEAGEIGEVVFTPFCKDYPLIRLATGDLSAFSLDVCPCGRTAPKLRGILGRVDDTAKVKGQFLYVAQVAQAVALFPAISAWQVVVDNPGGKDRLRLRYACGADMDEDALREQFQALCKLRPELEACEADDFQDEGKKLVDLRVYE